MEEINPRTRIRSLELQRDSAVQCMNLLAEALKDMGIMPGTVEALNKILVTIAKIDASTKELGA
jgi:hypothetical protein